jgi:hypothetical protein
MEREEQIRRLAYSIWEKEGYPEGRDIEHWLKAETLWRSKASEQDSGKDTNPPQQKRGRRSRSAQKPTSH